MALQGINLPLAFTGQEAIWQKVFQVLLLLFFNVIGSVYVYVIIYRIPLSRDTFASDVYHHCRLFSLWVIVMADIVG